MCHPGTGDIGDTGRGTRGTRATRHRGGLWVPAPLQHTQEVKFQSHEASCTGTTDTEDTKDTRGARAQVHQTHRAGIIGSEVAQSSLAGVLAASAKRCLAKAFWELLLPRSALLSAFVLLLSPRISLSNKPFEPRACGKRAVHWDNTHCIENKSHKRRVTAVYARNSVAMRAHFRCPSRSEDHGSCEQTNLHTCGKGRRTNKSSKANV